MPVVWMRSEIRMVARRFFFFFGLKRSNHQQVASSVLPYRPRIYIHIFFADTRVIAPKKPETPLPHLRGLVYTA